MKAQRISQVVLAKRLHCARTTLNRVLNGKDSLRPEFAARIQELMDADSENIKAAVPDEVEKQLRAWAEEAHATIEQVVEQLIRELPRFRK